jgi:hypothetical protein
MAGMPRKIQEGRTENPLVFAFFAHFSENPKTNCPLLTYYCKRKCRADALTVFTPAV